ncbi:decaprenyl-phosphate phosphoribosyltransferase [Kitasatospora albolonga]|uniref:decaprenyl-phosphate phosphoribosyltransferase n=1 Tax=Kitasatospora albolonga TaxID=68173 RepID=UPI0031EC4A04
MADRTVAVGDLVPNPSPRVPRPAGAQPVAAGRTAASVAVGLLRTVRPRQWAKNLLVLAAPAAAGQLTASGNPSRLLLVFVLFTAAAGAVYLLNDALDVEADRAHPAKCRRPIAAGTVPVALAFAAAAVLACTALVGSYLALNAMATAAVAAYLVVQAVYCTTFKHLLVVDLVVVSSGFLVRALVGGLAIGVPISGWFLITTSFGALFVVSAKRYSELKLMADRAGATRELLADYSVGYLRFVWQLAAGATMLSYCLWATGYPAATAVTHPAVLPWRELSIAPFLIGVLRYGVFADHGTAGAPEDVILRDRPLLITALVWTAVYGCAVHGR